MLALGALARRLLHGLVLVPEAHAPNEGAGVPIPAGAALRGGAGAADVDDLRADGVGHRAGAEVRARILCRAGTDATQEERVRSLKRLLQLSPGLPWAEIQLRRSENSTTKIDEHRPSGLRGLFRRKK